ncbi:hypothetical protein OSB04_022844 [Centaurea solstitialis]|uniref:PRA1 family protein n=1 Tax=Centaurea solstitialis TaxID=347529 RepID=A0AA38W1Q8_9ASTR|nr:hypothetical protein OSB04_022844 [Centaurea solstitialis]
MASSSPAILPISNSQTTTTAVESQPPVATPAVRNFINNLTENVRSGLSKRRPWSELLDRSAFSKPDSITDAAARIRKNYSYFRVNYLTVISAVLAFSLLTNPFSLIILTALLAAWLFLYLFRPSDPPLIVFGRTIVVIFLTSVGSVLISALLLGTAVVSAHGAFRTPEDLFLDEQEAGASTGFLSFLGGAASNAAASAAPIVAAARA